MARRAAIAAVLVGGLMATQQAILWAQASPLPIIAIMDFDASPGGWTLPPPRFGETAAQLMLDRLVAAREFHVLDGQWLSRGVKTGDPRALDALLANARAAGVNYVVLGSITQFSAETRQRHAGGGLPHVPLAGFRRQTNQLAVSILARVVDVQTGEVVTTGAGTGIGARGGVSVGALLIRPFGFGGFQNGVFQARDAQLNEALTRAIDTVARSLASAAPRLTARGTVTSNESRR